MKDLDINISLGDLMTDSNYLGLIKKLLDLNYSVKSIEKILVEVVERAASFLRALEKIIFSKADKL